MNQLELIERIHLINSPEEMKAVEALIRSLPGRMSRELQGALLDKLREVGNASKALVAEATGILNRYGIDHTTGEWLSTANYASRYGLSGPEVVSHWITKGIIPINCVTEVPELELSFVRNTTYR